jgi:hypothetical protein
MHEDITRHVAEGQGYDRGFTAGTRQAHELLTQFQDTLKHKRNAHETQGNLSTSSMNILNVQINSIDHAKLILRKGVVESQTIS